MKLKQLIGYIGIAALLSSAATASPKKVIPNSQSKKVNEQELAAAVLIAEAGAEGVVGLKCVAEVIKNRMKEKNKTIFQVVTQKNAFSCLNRWRNNLSGFIAKNRKHKHFSSALLIIKTYNGNITKNANFYHEKTKTPIWSSGFVPTAIVGNHKFFALAGF